MNRLACALGDVDVPGDLAVALPERGLAGQEGIVWRRLDLTVFGDGPRGDGVLTRGRRAPFGGPEGPRELATLALIVKEGRRLPGSFVDPDLDPLEGSSPGRTHDLVRVTLFGHLRRGGLEPAVPDRGEGPDTLPIAFFFPDGHVVARHEIALVAAVAHLDAVQPLHVGDAVPTPSDQSQREAVQRW